jgi:hypothetical protein
VTRPSKIPTPQPGEAQPKDDRPRPGPYGQPPVAAPGAPDLGKPKPRPN